MKDDYKDYLEYIRKIYRNGETSALVGAGFSKNLYSNYPDWSDLLFDMITEIFHDEIERAYSNYRHQSRKNGKIKTRSEFVREYALLLSYNYGYLNIVSKYIDIKGYRECVDSYIEERIPYFDKDSMVLKFRTGSTPAISVSTQNLKTHESFLRLKSLNNIYTTNYDNLLEEVAEANSINWKAVRNSSKLRLSAKNKSIVKIHGSLDKVDSSTTKNEFCFDGNYDIKYIISKEDYANYPTKHEAFMQMMRISLLRESFLLFGFSGKDPNFIAWIKWVRDVLVKDEERENDYSLPDYYKIFLFAYDSNEPSESEKQFYINHRILYIPILSNDICSIVGSYSDNPMDNIINYLMDNENDYKAQVVEKEAFDIIETNDSHLTMYNDEDIKEITKELTVKSGYYSELWRTVLDKNEVIKDEVAQKIADYRNIQRFIKSVSLQEFTLQKFSDKKDISTQIAGLLLYAAKDVCLPLDQYPVDLSQFIDDDNCVILRQHCQRFDLLEDYHKLKITKLSNSDYESDYNYILSLAFDLNFKALKEYLEVWIPHGYMIQNKAMLENFIKIETDGREIGKKLLLDYLEQEPNKQERYHATNLLNIINRTYPNQYSTDEYENEGLLSLWEMKEYLFDELKKEKIEFTPYGWNGSKRQLGSDNHKILAPIRVLQFMIDSGMLVSVGIMNIISANDWYLVSRALYESYPYPILWYTLQCSDEKILKRIGQDFAYSDSLKDQIPTILDKLFKAYFGEDTPNRVKRSILKIAPSLFVSVPATKWAKYFMKIWSEKYVAKIETIYSQSDLNPFIQAGIPYITQPVYINRIILDSIVNISASSEYIDAIFHVKKVDSTTLKIRREIDKLIQGISNGNDIWILCNLNHILSQQQISNIIDKFIELTQHQVWVSARIIPAISYLVTKSDRIKEQEDVIKESIIKHKSLWCNGLNSSGESGFSFFNNGNPHNTATPPAYIVFSKIGQNINWNKTDLIAIYNNLVVSYNELKASSFFQINEDDDFFSLDYKPLLNEMLLFLEEYTMELKEVDNFDSLKAEINGELINRRQFVDIEEGLWSSEKETVILALKELDRSIKERAIDDNIKYIDILLSRIALQNNAALYSCINYAFHYLDKYREELLTDERISLMLIILKRYQGDVCLSFDMDKVKVYSEFISLAKILQDMGNNNETITYWIEQKNRFVFLKS